MQSRFFIAKAEPHTYGQFREITKQTTLNSQAERGAIVMFNRDHNAVGTISKVSKMVLRKYNDKWLLLKRCKSIAKVREIRDVIESRVKELVSNLSQTSRQINS